MASVAKKVLDSARAVTTTVSSVSQAIENPFSEFVAFLKAESVAGGSNITATLQHSPNTNDWITVGAFTAVTGNGVQELQVTKNLFPHVRVTYTVASGSGTFTCELFYSNKR